MTGAGARTTALLVDDHAVVREGYRRLLERRGEVEVVAEAASADEAIHSYQALMPAVTIMDIALPGISGVEATRRIIEFDPDARVLVFSMYEDAIYVSRAFQAGACGYITKASAPNDLVDAVRIIAGGGRYLSPDITVGAEDALSAREFEILRMLVQGHDTRDIARSMGLSAKTIANYQSTIKQKLRVDTQMQLARAGAALLCSPMSVGV